MCLRCPFLLNTRENLLEGTQIMRLYHSADWRLDGKNPHNSQCLKSRTYTVFIRKTIMPTKFVIIKHRTMCV